MDLGISDDVAVGATSPRGIGRTSTLADEAAALPGTASSYRSSPASDTHGAAVIIDGGDSRSTL